MRMPPPVPDSIPAPIPAAANEGDGLIWNRLIEQYKNRLPAMCRAFLDSAYGTLEGDILQVVCSNDMAKNILQEKAAAVLQSVTGEAVGHPVSVVFSVGQVVPTQPKNSLDELLSFGSRLDNFTVKGE